MGWFEGNSAVEMMAGISLAEVMENGGVRDVKPN
jgi:hypothetical protein